MAEKMYIIFKIFFLTFISFFLTSCMTDLYGSYTTFVPSMNKKADIEIQASAGLGGLNTALAIAIDSNYFVTGMANLGKIGFHSYYYRNFSLGIGRNLVNLRAIKSNIMAGVGFGEAKNRAFYYLPSSKNSEFNNQGTFQFIYLQPSLSYLFENYLYFIFAIRNTFVNYSSYSYFVKNYDANHLSKYDNFRFNSTSNIFAYQLEPTATMKLKIGIFDFWAQGGWAFPFSNYYIEEMNLDDSIMINVGFSIHFKESMSIKNGFNKNRKSSKT